MGSQKRGLIPGDLKSVNIRAKVHTGIIFLRWADRARGEKEAHVQNVFENES